MNRDDFEFKPLTEGLGFHKKVIDIKEELHPAPQRTVPVSSKPPESFWNPTLKNKDLIEKTAKPVPKPVQKPQVFNSPVTVPVATSWPAAIFDSTMVLGLLLIFSAVIFAVTKIDFSQLMEMLSTEPAAQMGAFVLVVSVYEIYTVACRTFFGKTVGESTFEYRLGTPEVQDRLIYPFQVAWRSFVIALTGFVTLPLLSTVLQQDLAGILSGVTLYSEKRP